MELLGAQFNSGHLVRISRAAKCTKCGVVMVPVNIQDCGRWKFSGRMRCPKCGDAVVAVGCN